MDSNTTELQGSDQVLDNCCISCQENGKNIEAICFCQQCNKCYCDECDKLHGQLYKKHEVFGRESLDKWPTGQVTIERLEQCKEHDGRKIELFCEDHNQLCCYECQFSSHRHCCNICVLAEKSKGIHETTDFKSLLCDIENQKEQFDKLKQELYKGLTPLKGSHGKAIEDIKAVRKKITDHFEEIEKKEIDAFNNRLQELQQSFQADIDQYTQICSELDSLAKATTTVAKKSETLSFILQNKYTNLSKVKKDVTQKYLTFRVNPEIDGLVTSFSQFGKVIINDKTRSINQLDCQNKTITVLGKPLHYEITTKGEVRCYVTCFHELPDGKIILTDRGNKKAKLLDSDYKVVSHLEFTNEVWSLCGVNDNDVAITVSGKTVYQLIFVKVINETITKHKTIELQHPCFGITYARSGTNLYVTSGTALYQYTSCGELVKKLYTDASSDRAVFKCGISPDETKIYVTDFNRNVINILGKDGTILGTLASNGWKGPNCIHITALGQVLVSANMSDSIQQIDIEGKHASTVIGVEDGVKHPGSVFYSSKKGVLIVGTNYFSYGDIMIFNFGSNY